MEADELRLGAGCRFCNGGVGEALGRRFGRALSVCRVWGGCEGCAGRERIRSDELRVLQLENGQVKTCKMCARLSYAVNAYAFALNAEDNLCALSLLDPTDAAHSTSMDAPICRAHRLGQRGQCEGRADLLVGRHCVCRACRVRCEVCVCVGRCVGRVAPATFERKEKVGRGLIVLVAKVSRQAPPRCGSRHFTGRRVACASSMSRLWARAVPSRLTLSCLLQVRQASPAHFRLLSACLLLLVNYVAVIAAPVNGSHSCAYCHAS